MKEEKMSMKDDRAERRREKANRPTVKYLRNESQIPSRFSKSSFAIPKMEIQKWKFHKTSCPFYLNSPLIRFFMVSEMAFLNNTTANKPTLGPEVSINRNKFGRLTIDASSSCVFFFILKNS